MARDHYDECMDYLVANPGEIRDAWGRPEHRAHALFKFAAPAEHLVTDVGCLTMIRSNDKWQAYTPELTAAIRADTRIPDDNLGVTPLHLPVFAEWQRRLDRELGRTPPALVEVAWG